MAAEWKQLSGYHGLSQTIHWSIKLIDNPHLSHINDGVVILKVNEYTLFQPLSQLNMILVFTIIHMWDIRLQQLAELLLSLHVFHASESY